MFFERDLFFFHEPLRRYWTSLVAAGHAPFLNAALNLGEPVLANPNNAVFYPGDLLYFVLPFETAWNLSLAGHVLWAALGLYWLARRLDCSRLAALSGALVFGFCGPLVSSLNDYGLLVAASWIPWTLGCARMSWRRGGAWTAAAALAFASQILAGEPTIVILTAALLLFGYVAGLLQDRSALRLALARGGAIAVVAALLVGIQAVPTLLWLPLSGRGEGLPFRQSAAYWSLHPQRLAEILVPHIHGNPMGRLAAEFWGGGLSDAGLPYIMNLYVGWIPLLLLPLAWRRPFGRWAALVVGLSLALALGHYLPGYHALYDVFAPFRVVRYPEKFTILAAFGLSLTTALALGRIDEAAPRRRVALLAAAGPLLALLPVLAVALPHVALSIEQRAEQLRAIGQAAIVGAVSLLLLILGTIPRYRRLATGLIPIVIVLDLASATWDIARTRPRSESDATPALFAAASDLASMPILHLGEQQSDAYFTARRDPFRSMQDALHPFTGLRWGATYGAVDDVDRMGWTGAAARQRFLHQTLLAASSPGGGGSPQLAEALWVMRECGIGRVVSLAPLSTPGLHEESAMTLPEGPTVRLYATDSAPLPAVRVESGQGALTWNEDAPHRLSISIDATTDITIVVARNDLPGWRAACDGHPVAISSTPEGLLRLSVPAGSKRLVLEYVPPGLLAGTFLTGAGFLGLAGIVVVARRSPESRRPLRRSEA